MVRIQLPSGDLFAERYVMYYAGQSYDKIQQVYLQSQQIVEGTPSRRNSGLMDWFDEQEDEEHRPARRNSRSGSMNRATAYQLDKNNGEFYASYDEESGGWCVFGTESGFAYESYSDPEQATERAADMNFYAKAGEHVAVAHGHRRNARYGGDPQWMTARFDSECSKCKRSIRKHDEIFYFPNGKRVFCNYDQCGVKASREFEAARFDEGY